MNKNNYCINWSDLKELTFIFAELDHDRKLRQKEYRVLLLGCGEAGKSTFIKQVEFNFYLSFGFILKYYGFTYFRWGLFTPGSSQMKNVRATAWTSLQTSLVPSIHYLMWVFPKSHWVWFSIMQVWVDLILHGWVCKGIAYLWDLQDRI